MSGDRLVVSGVSHAYGRLQAARDVSFRVSAGDVHCLLGASGSGKSTLLRLIAGLEILQSGSIEIEGAEVASPSVHRRPEERAVGFVFQDYALFPHLDVRRNVTFGMERSPKTVKAAAADELLSLVGMADSAQAMPHTLSGGQQQRVALARALARKPSVMLLDEPFSSLDARLRKEVRLSTLEILRSAHVATVLVTHDSREVLAVADTVSVIDRGAVLQTGAPREVYERSTSRTVAEIFGAVNRLEATVRGGSVATPFGEIAAAGFDDGQEVEVLVRPENVRLSSEPQESFAAATILAVRSSGALLEVSIVLPDGLLLHSLEMAPSDLEVGASLFVGFEAGAPMVVGAGTAS